MGRETAAVFDYLRRHAGHRITTRDVVSELMRSDPSLKPQNIRNSLHYFSRSGRAPRVGYGVFRVGPSDLFAEAAE
jgi:Fe2+ or Zn2+ uptake regulation protein